MIQDVSAIIVGGGPAGCSVAIQLARAGQKAVILERSGYDATRIGELLPPTANPHLHRLGALETCHEHLQSPGIVSIWGSPNPYENDFVFNPYGNGWHLDRRKFDESLARLARACGASLHCRVGAVSISLCDDGRWELEAPRELPTQRFHADFLIDATGRTRLLLRRLGARPKVLDRLVGIVADFSIPPEWEADRRMWLEAEENGWWYSAVLPDCRMITAYMTDADLLPAEMRSIDVARLRLRRTLFKHSRSPTDLQSRGFRVVAAASYLMDRVAGPNWIAVGDAAMAWDPISGQGVTKAMESGTRAAEAILKMKNGNRTALQEYSDWVTVQFEGYRRDWARFYRAEARWPRSRFWQRRVGEPAQT